MSKSLLTMLTKRADAMMGCAGQNKLLIISILTLLIVWCLWFQLPFATTESEKVEIVPSSDSAPTSPPKSTKEKPRKDRPLVVYAYSESEAARENLQFFVEKGVHGAADFIFIFNGETNATEMIPDLPNVQTVERPNTCYDLGAIGEVLRKDGLWKKYSKFITMNASLRGPFLPVWSRDCWTDLFLNRITTTVKLVGISLNCQPRPHIQSMIFATDQTGMYTLLEPTLATSVSVDDQFGSKDDPVGLSGCYENWNAAVHAEVGTTDLILNSGYQVDALMTSMHADSTPAKYCAEKHDNGAGDMWWNGRYFGGNLHPYETIFYKANRNVEGDLMASLTKWHLQMKWNSFEYCGRS